MTLSFRVFADNADRKKQTIKVSRYKRLLNARTERQEKAYQAALRRNPGVMAKIERQVERIHQPTVQARQEREDHARIRHSNEVKHKAVAEEYRAKLRRAFIKEDEREDVEKKRKQEYFEDARLQRDHMANRFRIRKLALAAQALSYSDDTELGTGKELYSPAKAAVNRAGPRSTHWWPVSPMTDKSGQVGSAQWRRQLETESQLPLSSPAKDITHILDLPTSAPKPPTSERGQQARGCTDSVARGPKTTR